MATRTRFRGRVTVAVLAALALTGCGGDRTGIAQPVAGIATAAGGAASPGAAQSGSPAVSGKLYALPDPCALLTKADAETALAEPVQESIPSTPGANPFGVVVAECDYEAVSGTTANDRANIGVTVRRYDAASGARIDFDSMDRGTPGTERKVSGLGDAAFVAGGDPPTPGSPRPRGGAVLVANLTLDFYIALVKAGDPGVALTGAMRRAVDRLPTAPAFAVSTSTAVSAVAALPPATRAVPTTQAAAPAPTAARTPAPVAAATGSAGQTTGGAAPGGDVCALLTKAEVEAALGGTIKTPEATNLPPMPVSPGVSFTPSACSYDAVSSPSSVHLTVFRSAGGTVADVQQFGAIVCGKKEPVPGLGDFACWYSAAHGELQVFRGNVFLDLAMLKLGKDVTQDLKTLATQALGRLA